MTLTFTRSDMAAAKRNDLTAITKIMDEMLPLIDAMAGRIAADANRPNMSEELASEGRLRLWELISDHADEDTDDKPVAGWVKRQIQGAMHDCVTAEIAPGVNVRAVQRYVECLKAAGGNHDLAEQAVQNLPPRKRLSADLAAEARAACESKKSLDAPISHERGVETLYDFLALKPSEDEQLQGDEVRAAYVHATLSQMSPKQSHILREFYLNEKPLEVIADEMGATVKQVTDNKTVARKTFHAKFPFAEAYNDTKPALVAEHGSAKSVREGTRVKDNSVKIRWAAAKMAAKDSDWKMSGALILCDYDECDIPKSGQHYSMCGGHVAIAHRRATWAVNSGRVVRGQK